MAAGPRRAGAVAGPSAYRLDGITQEDLAPSGAKARVRANLAALGVLADLREQGRAATAMERQILAKWSAWGAVPQVFDERNTEWDDLRSQVRAQLDGEQWAAARRTTINAHYTDPAYIAPMWGALTRLGFTGGRVLEPGSGAGTFIGLAPAGAQMTGVELDPISAELSAALYPQAEIRGESFATTRFPTGWFDAAIGNVPFADVTLHDPVHNRGQHSIHNHFLIKSVAMVRPGGLAVFLTSRYTMDGSNPAARRELNQMADLVGAIRLPGGAHRRAAGTDVVTDLLILRRRLDGEPVRDETWETVGAHKVDDVIVHTNNYFHDHPENVLGTYEVGHGMYGEQTLNVRGDLTSAGVDAAGALERITARAIADGLVQADRDETVTLGREHVRAAAPDEAQWEGHLTAGDDGTFTILASGLHEPLTVPRTQTGELTALIGLRDAAKELLGLEASTLEDTADVETARATLKTRYETYAATYGPLNRATLRSTGRVDEATGETRMARVRPPVMQIFRRDPFSPLVYALENYDDATSSATPAAIMSQRVVVPRTPALGADTADEALAITLDSVGRVDLERVAHLLGTTEDDARAQLGQLVYDDTATGQLVSAPEYLSGNIAIKLDAARAAAAADDAYRVNVDALEDVMPTPLGQGEIVPRVGAAWIDSETHQQFLRETLGDRYVTVEHGGGSMWDVDGGKYGVAATSQWGTERAPAGAIFKAMLEQRVVQVMDQIDDRRVLNATETEAARAKQTELQERFADWVWEDPERADRLTAAYNRTFNSIVLRDYTAEGERLTLPGLVRTFTPRPHQRTAVARMISEPAVGLFHEVGAGKTAEMVMGAMELKRLGLVSKPAVVVPNHMLEQFSREWLQLYPQARLLAASSDDLARDRRRLFVARAATGDWDAIVMTRGAFERVPVSAATQSAYMTTELDELRTQLEAMSERGGRGLTVKRLEKKIAADEERLKAKLDGVQDAGLTFEETGIDYLIVDEAHEYKNLRTASNIPDATIEGSKRAADLHMKLEYLRSRHGERVVTVATATPIANSVTEAHVMQRYLRPDLLADAGVKDFDAWAATFGQTVTEIEMGVAGGFKQKTRFARFQNVPEMLRMWHTSADVRTAEDLQLPAPDLALRPDGQRGATNVVLDPSPQLVSYVEHLGERADLVRARAVDVSTDNMLLISSDGRKAALDMRLTGAPRSPGNKIEAAATKIAAIWRQNADRVYLDPATGEPAALPGALQIVFSDLGTPREGWNVYDELRDQLVGHGLTRSSVRFIHEAKNDVEKGRLFAACRSGQVSVLVGSTAKMGVGTNIQDRAIALHHLDCPWRPADLQQRDGRILRQGNQNPEVQIYRWVVERSFDAYSWQTVERKAKFIAQIMRGRLDVREIEDIGETALSFGEVKALSSGDPLVMEREQAAADVLRLERLERAWHQQRAGLNRTILGSQATVATADRDIPLLERAVAATHDTAGDAFTMSVAGAPAVQARSDAGTQISTWVRSRAHTLLSARRDADVPMGDLASIGGHTITAAARGASLGRPAALMLSIKDAPGTTWAIPVDDLDPSGVGIVRQIENRLQKMPADLAGRRDERERAAHSLDAARAGLDEPFKHADALVDARGRLTDIETQMQAVAPQDNNVAEPAAPTGAPQDDADPAPSEPTGVDDLMRASERDHQRRRAGRHVDRMLAEIRGRSQPGTDGEPLPGGPTAGGPQI
ncbi:helicase [Luteimicrobium sp. DT211]|uniref:helicase n=1 Tax=Luteimicrobium sp. DT211 TaxID=3393412 RepID=UPI003CF61D13